MNANHLAIAIGALAFTCAATGYAQDAAKTAAPPSASAAKPAGAAAGPPVGAIAPAAPAETGLAAVYSDRLNGRKTASGQVYDRNKLTAAHKSLPFGTLVKVTNLKNQKTVTVRINDRGPTQTGRILDLSPQAARALGIRPTGMAEVSAEVAQEAQKRRTP
jgi:rare lipoprotein A